MADPRDITTDEITESTTNDASGCIARLGVATSVLDRVKLRLQAIEAVAADIPEPDRPSVLTALAGTQAKISALSSAASALDVELRRT